MTTEIFIPITGDHPSGQGAREYLSSVLSTETINSICDFQKKQQQLFREHATDLAELLAAVQAAPSKFHPNELEDALIEWLKEQGVSSSRITQLKGAVRLKRRVLSGKHNYSESEKRFILGLEVEKAYLFGRLTWEGQRQAYRLFKERGKLSLRDLRELNKNFEYDSSVLWKDGADPKSFKNQFDKRVLSISPLPEDIHDLCISFQFIVEKLSALENQWISNQAFADLIDPASLIKLNKKIIELCNCQWYEDDF